MKYLLLLLISVTTFAQSSLSDVNINYINSDTKVNWEDFKGKKILIVNVASKCGYTPQYKELQELASKYKDKLVILGVPCNQFMGQEPGTEEEIVKFCSSKYNVTFPMTEKVDVKGKDQHTLYQFLTKKEFNKKSDYKVSWNFNKFLLDENGNLIKYFPSSVKPMDQQIVSFI